MQKKLWPIFSAPFDLKRLSIVENYKQQFTELKLGIHLRGTCFIYIYVISLSNYLEKNQVSFLPYLHDTGAMFSSLLTNSSCQRQFLQSDPNFPPSNICIICLKLAEKSFPNCTAGTATPQM